MKIFVNFLDLIERNQNLVENKINKIKILLKHKNVHLFAWKLKRNKTKLKYSEKVSFLGEPFPGERKYFLVKICQQKRTEKGTKKRLKRLSTSTETRNHHTFCPQNHEILTNSLEILVFIVKITHFCCLFWKKT